jgi:DNA-binding NarL/FixJ family response regulator
VITDDNSNFRRALADVLEASSRFNVVGETGTGEEAVELVGRLRPGVVVMDLNMPGGIDGIEATRQIRHNWPGAMVVLVSTLLPSDVPSDVGTCGAVGYFPKDKLTPGALFSLWARSQELGG